MTRPISLRRPQARSAGTPAALVSMGVLVALFLAGPPPGGPAGAGAQQAPEERRDLLESRDRLAALQEERQRLREELEDLDHQVADVGAELRNLERQLSTSRSVLAEIRSQVDAVRQEAEEVDERLERAREELERRRRTLHGRVREMYKRGPLHAVEVLLGADSFADLLNRYRYLHLMARHDRGLVGSVAATERELEARSRDLRSRMEELEGLLEAQQREVAELEEVERERRRALEEYRARKAEMEEELEATGSGQGLRYLDRLVEELDAARRSGPHDGAPLMEPPGAPTLTSAQLGRVPWPVQGNSSPVPGAEDDAAGGVAIRASFGEPVRAVRRGSVALAGPLEGFGSIVILSHGEGHYTLYLQLDEAGVVQGRIAEEGQVVGTVGGMNTDLGPHLEFHVRVPGEDGAPRPADAADWLAPTP